jgi:transcriptional antiterminator RfaH
VGELYSEVAISAFPLWYALVVEPRHERYSAKLLDATGFETFLPLCKLRLSQKPRRNREQSCSCGVCRKCRDRARKFASRGEAVDPEERPLFPGYLFCRFPFYEKPNILSTLGIMSVVQFGPVPIAVPDYEIHALQTAVAAGIDLTPLPYEPHIGDRVEVTDGPFKGQVVRVREIDGKGFLILDISLLGRSNGVPFTLEQVQKAA